MSQRTVYDCDMCSKKDASGVVSFGVAIERYQDGAGSTDTRDAQFDLCAGCQVKVLTRVFSGMYLQDGALSKLNGMLGFNPVVR